MLKRLSMAGGILVSAIFPSQAFAQGFPIYKVADTSTQIPGAAPGQLFTSFDPPTASRNPIALGPETPTVGFRATGPNGLIGIYSGSPSSYFNPTFTPFRLADTTMAIPSPSPAGTFADFTGPTYSFGFGGFWAIFTGQAASGVQAVYRIGHGGGSISSFGTSGASFTRATAPSAMGDIAAFAQGDSDGLSTMLVRDETQIVGVDDAYLGAPSVSHAGFNPPGIQTRVTYAARNNPTGPMSEIRVYRPELSGNQVRTVAGFTTSIPAGTGTFTGFGDPAAGANSVYFRGSGSGGQQGIYQYQIGPAPSALFAMYDRSSPVPGRPGVTFTGFSDPAVYQNTLAFVGILSDGNEALYSPLFITGGPSGLTKLISTGDVIGGKTIDALEISREAIGGALNADYAFKATFTDGSEGIYVLKLPEPGMLTLGLGAIVLLTARRRGLKPGLRRSCRSRPRLSARVEFAQRCV